MTMLGSEPSSVHFPDSAEVPESTWHFELRSLIYDFLTLAFGSLEFLAGQVVGKLWMTVLAVALLWAWRRRLAPAPGATAG